MTAYVQAQYHITRDDPCKPNWPKGAWSVYAITGDQIAERVIWQEYNLERGYPKGKVVWRHSW
jgi:hypothetical protein